MPTRPARALSLLLAGAVVGPIGLGLGAGPAQARPAPGAATTQVVTSAPVPAAPYRIEPFAPRRTDPVRLRRQWNVWRSQDLPRYLTDVRRSCECVQRRPVRTSVDGRRVLSVSYVGGRELRRHGWEVAELYRLLRRGYAEADDVRVRFRDGVPRSIAIDWDRDIADEETFLSVRLVPVG
ncbi:hypothetical protein GCM10023340_07070 [Nocardioides marinquilinus]|uniref:Uncharacterized protein n=1 Tax=Nocardioides marinquilinus TaxID=1210400 RepID=A0ABP9P9A7_9ACTN